MAKDKRYTVGKTVYNIPDSEVKSFMTDNPEAIEVEGFEAEGTTYNIPLNEVSQFKTDMPSATALKKKEVSVSASVEKDTDSEIQSIPLAPNVWAGSLEKQKAAKKKFASEAGTNISKLKQVNEQLFAQRKELESGDYERGVKGAVERSDALLKVDRQVAEVQKRIFEQASKKADAEGVEKGSIGGAIYNSLVEGFTKYTEDAADAVLKTMAYAFPEGAGAKTSEEAMSYVDNTLDDLGIKKTLDKKLKSESASEAFIQQIKEEGGIATEGAFGLAESVFPMMTPKMSGFFVTSFVDGVNEIKEANPELSATGQMAYGTAQGAVMMTLERFGFRNILRNNAYIKELTKRVLSESMQEGAKKITANQLAKAAERIVTAGAAEFETGAAQYVAEEGVRQASDLLSGEDAFKFEGAEDFLANTIRAGAVELVGGHIMGTVSAAPGLIKRPKSKSKANDLVKENEALMEDMGNPDVSQEAKEAVSTSVNNNLKEILEVGSEDAIAFNKLEEQQQKEVTTLSEKVNDLDNALEDENLSEESLKAIEAQKTAIDKQIDDIYEKYKGEPEITLQDVSAEERLRLVDLASKQLQKEKIEAGETEFTITEEETNDRALEILKTETDAIQERETETVPPQPGTGTSGEVGQEIQQESQSEGETSEKEEKITDVSKEEYIDRLVAESLEADTSIPEEQLKLLYERKYERSLAKQPKPTEVDQVAAVEVAAKETDETVRAIAEEYASEMQDPTDLSHVERTIMDNMANVSRQSFIDVSDEANISEGLAKSYLRKEGKPLDTYAQELSEIAGKEVTEQDIVDFMLRFPEGRGIRDRSKRAKELAEQYKEVTGKRLDKRIAANILEKAKTEEDINKALEFDEVKQLLDDFVKPDGNYDWEGLIDAIDNDPGHFQIFPHNLTDEQLKRLKQNAGNKEKRDELQRQAQDDTTIDFFGETIKAGKKEEIDDGTGESEENDKISEGEEAPTGEVGEFPPEVEATLEEHAKHHTPEHMADMREAMAEGQSFEEAHKAAQAKEAKPQEEPEKEKPKRVKKKVVTERAYEGTVRKEVKAHLEKIGLTRDQVSQNERSKQAEDFIEQFGENAVLDAVREGDVRGAIASSVIAKLIQRTDAKMAALDATDVDRLDELASIEAELIEYLGQEAFFGGEFNSQLAFEYDNSDIGYNAEKKIVDYEEKFGKVPQDVEDKFRALETEMKSVKKNLSEEEEKLTKSEEERAMYNIIEDVKRTQKDPRKKQYAKNALDAISKARKTIKSKQYADVTGMIAIVDSALLTMELAIKGGMKVADAIETGVEYVKRKLKEKGAVEWEKEDEFRKDMADAFKDGGIEVDIRAPQVNAKGRLSIPQDLIRSLVEDGIDTIEELTKAIHEIVIIDLPEATEREVRDAITGYGKTVNPNKDEISREIRKMKTIGRTLSSLEDIAEKKRPLKSGKQRDKLDAEERAAMKQVREAMKDLPFDEGVQAEEQRTALDTTKQRVRNQIEDLQREIDLGERVERSARTLKEDQELITLKAERDSLKLEHDQLFKDEDFQQRKRLEITKKRTGQRIEFLRNKIKAGDYEKKVLKPLKADQELLELRADKLRIQEEYDKAFYKAQLAQRTRWEKVKDALWDAWGLTRVLRATGEASFVGIQGLINTIAHPKHAREAIVRTAKFMSSEKKTEKWLKTIRAQEWYDELKLSRLSLTEPNAQLSAREELFYSDWANMVWDKLIYPLKLVSDKAYQKGQEFSPFKIVERGAVGYLDTMRVLRFLDGRAMLEMKGITFEDNPQAYKDMADVVNTFTGRASLGPLEQISETLTKLLFSPRNWASAVKSATPYAFYHFGKMRAGAEGWKPSVAQKMALTDFSRFVGFTSSIVAMVAISLNNDDDDETGVEMDPRSSDFMKIKLGELRIDPWGGKIQQIVFIARMLTDSIKNGKGEIVPLGVPYKSPTRFDLMLQQATNKLAPSASILHKYMAADVDPKTGKKQKWGEEVSIPGMLQENIYPIYWETIKEIINDESTTGIDGLLIFYAFFGGGVNIYGPEANKRNKKKKGKEKKKKSTYYL